MQEDNEGASSSCTFTSKPPKPRARHEGAHRDQDQFTRPRLRAAAAAAGLGAATAFLGALVHFERPAAAASGSEVVATRAPELLERAASSAAAIATAIQRPAFYALAIALAIALAFLAGLWAAKRWPWMWPWPRGSRADRQDPPENSVPPAARALEELQKLRHEPGYTGDLCAICFDPVSRPSDGYLFCGHNFHKQCLERRRAGGAAEICPVCEGLSGAEGPYLSLSLRRIRARWREVGPECEAAFRAAASPVLYDPETDLALEGRAGAGAEFEAEGTRPQPLSPALSSADAADRESASKAAAAAPSAADDRDRPRPVIGSSSPRRGRRYRRELARDAAAPSAPAATPPPGPAEPSDWGVLRAEAGRRLASLKHAPLSLLLALQLLAVLAAYCALAGAAFVALWRANALLFRWQGPILGPIALLALVQASVLAYVLTPFTRRAPEWATCALERQLGWWERVLGPAFFGAGVREAYEENGRIALHGGIEFARIIIIPSVAAMIAMFSVFFPFAP
eukprot:tig00020560_g11074.t1